MYRASLASPDDFDGWRKWARGFIQADVGADAILWSVAGDAEDSGGAAGDLFAGDALPAVPLSAGAQEPRFTVPRAFIDMAEKALLHSDPQRFSLLYDLLLRLRQGRARMEDRSDPLVMRLEAMARSVRRDMHKMRAFLRFREVTEEDGSARFVAWFEPDHHIVRANAGFFIRRFSTMNWSILTPEISLHWDGESLMEGPGASRSDAPEEDPVEEMWKGYYAAIFNPARLKIGAMLKEMPKKYWRNMPETALVADLVAGARARESAMIDAGGDHGQQSGGKETPTLPARPAGGNVSAAWEGLRKEAMACTRCHLHRDATQTVFGEGPLDAPLMFVGEQPGDQEDLAGRPFVGPAGQLFNEALERAGIDRSRAYVTNAVKHFKFERRGKRRIHQTPDGPEIEACRWWLRQEMEVLQPRIIVALGATAARALMGKTVTLSRVRGQAIDLPGTAGEGWITVHPSYLLRIPDEAKKMAERARFLEELRLIGARVKAIA